MFADGNGIIFQDIGGKAAVIDGGRVVADGPKDQVLADLNKGRVRAAV